MSILWIDDDVHLVVSDGKILGGKTGCRINYAVDISTALAKIESESPKLILLDLRIPVGSLPRQFSNLRTYFESDKENAGFGFLRLFCESISAIKNLDQVRHIVVCSDYQKTYVERFVTARQSQITLFPKSQLRTDFEDFLGLCARQLDVADSKDQHRTVEASRLDGGAPAVAVSPSEKILYDALHEMRRSFRIIYTTTNDLRKRSGRSSATTLNRLSPGQVRKVVDAVEQTLDAAIDRFDSQPKKIAALEKLVARSREFKNALEPFSPSMSSMISDYFSRTQEISASVDVEFARQIEYILKPIDRAIDNFFLDVINNQVTDAIIQMDKIEGLSSPKSDAHGSFYPDQEIRKIIADLSVEAERLQINLHQRTTDIIRHRVVGDRAAFITAISNLLDNAMKYSFKMPRRRAWINVDGRAMAARRIRIEIENWGPKIDDSEIERILRTRERGQRAFGEGSGRGLAIVEDSLEKLGATLQVESFRANNAVRRASDESAEAHQNKFSFELEAEVS